MGILTVVKQGYKMDLSGHGCMVHAWFHAVVAIRDDRQPWGINIITKKVLEDMTNEQMFK